MDDRLTQLPAGDLIARLASAEPIPGGGSAAALAGAMSAALVEMVVALSRGRAADAGDEATLSEIGAAAAGLRAALIDLTERDAAAYASVVTARRLPRDSDPERAARADAVAAATRDATRAPLDTARRADEVLSLAERLAPIGNRNAISDVGVAALLAAAAVRGAALNVRINRPYLAADDSLHAAAEELETLLRAVPGREASIAGLVAERMT